jgi:hypothetical protein
VLLVGFGGETEGESGQWFSSTAARNGPRGKEERGRDCLAIL